ncbi:MAG TPA: PPC domain-containing protein [Pirellulales bacterium]|nr:PPC domain-containing protein [Pirellulales bacterium]
MTSTVHRVVVVGLAVLLASNVALAQRRRGFGGPRLNGIAPYGAQRGTEIDVSFNGDDLEDAQEIMLYYPGIKVLSLEAGNEKAVKTRLQIAPDCRIGIHAMRMRTATGISNLRTFSVGAMPEVAEVEPNSEFATPQKINLDVTVNGFVNNEDVDYYLVEAKKGERITAEIEGIRLGNFFFDPVLSVLDKNRFELTACDDAALVWQDGVVSIVAPDDGQYTIMVRESAFGGNGACTYRLHVGRFPRPTAAIPAGGKPGETVALRWLGDMLGERSENYVVPVDATVPFGLFAKDDKGISPSPNAFVLDGLTNVMEVEPNDAPVNAPVFETPAALNGVIEKDGDIDFFKFAAKKGQQLDIHVLGRGIRSQLDPVLYIHREDGGTVAGNDDSGGPDSYLRFNPPADGNYLVSVRDHLNKGRVDYAYRVQLEPVHPRLTMGLPERRQYFDITTSVPQGNRMAILVSAQRKDFGGELLLDMKDLPAGLTFETVPMAANQSQVPVLFTAAPGATLAGALVDVIGRPTDSKIPVEGHVEQVTGLVRGQNNIMVWGHTAHRMATAITAEAPFTIDVVEPKVPLVRNGSMGLKVVAKRKEGFTAPIAIRMLYNPPGVGSSGDIKIAENENEAVIPLTANGGAEIRHWKIAVIGRSNVGDEGIMASTQLANLEVAEPYVKFAFNATACEQGQETDVVVKVENNKAFEGEAVVELLGTPFEVTTEPTKLTKDATELVFHVKTTAKSPAGRHKTLLCRATVMANGEPIVHNLGGGELRIDTPLPPKPTAPAPMPTAVAAAPQPEKPPEKRLTRLEQLRLEREKALKSGQKPEAAAGAGGGGQ